MVPKHEIVSREEKKELLERFNIEKEQLPIVLVSDAVIKKIGAKPGDVVRISRKSATAGQHTYYRMVTE
jgi:DNA-directed RNA polymerase subunit H